ASWYRHFLLQNRDAAPGFFQFTPEIMLSWFLDEMGCDLWNDRIEGKRNSVSSKLPIYQRHFALEERPKYTGFEQVQDLDYKYRLQYRKFYENSDYIVKSPVPTLVAQMMGPVFKKNDLDLRRYISEFENDDWKTSLKLNELPPVELIDGRMYYEFASTNP
ncbi:MAG: hypothetical protein RBT63_09845, partial [Bdellovibrionales bacterium]|nr:hypothetical protein [Bdellovibrionales bacterium]